MTLSIPMIRGRAAVLPAAAFVSIACAGPPVAPPPPPPDVTVATPATRDVTNYAEFTGRTASIATVEIRARVAGELQSMEFEPSSQVYSSAPYLERGLPQTPTNRDRIADDPATLGLEMTVSGNDDGRLALHRLAVVT